MTQDDIDLIYRDTVERLRQIARTERDDEDVDLYLDALRPLWFEVQDEGVVEQAISDGGVTYLHHMLLIYALDNFE